MIGRPPDYVMEEPLYLNKFIESGNLEEAREAALVRPFCGDIKSYSGFITVDQDNECHMFFWFFPSEKDSNAPLLVWLNGWATPSTYGIFIQNGPYKLDENGQPVLREESWHKWYNIVYIDSPLGVGYSHAINDSKYSKNLKEVASNLYWTIYYFFKLFPELQHNDLYLTGLSMGGNYITHLTHEIQLANDVHRNEFNLKGLFIGNPLIGGAYQFRYAEFLLQLGFIDKNEKDIMQTLEEGIIELIEQGKYDEAIKSAQGFIFSSNSYIKDLTGLSDLYDLRNYDSTTYDSTMKRYTEFMKKEEVRHQINVNSQQFSEDIKPLFLLRSEIPKSSTALFQKLLNNYRCCFYCGQFDVVCNYPSFSNILSSLEWPGADSFNKTARVKLYQDDKVYGYSKSYNNLTEVTIRNAGHSVLEDQPDFILQLLHTFTQYYDINNLAT